MLSSLRTTMPRRIAMPTRPTDRSRQLPYLTTPLPSRVAASFLAASVSESLGSCETDVQYPCDEA
jgi:hypothetical protein